MISLVLDPYSTWCRGFKASVTNCCTCPHSMLVLPLLSVAKILAPTTAGRAGLSPMDRCRHVCTPYILALRSSPCSAHGGQVMEHDGASMLPAASSTPLPLSVNVCSSVPVLFGAKSYALTILGPLTQKLSQYSLQVRPRNCKSDLFPWGKPPYPPNDYYARSSSTKVHSYGSVEPDAIPGLQYSAPSLGFAGVLPGVRMWCALRRPGPWELPRLELLTILTAASEGLSEYRLQFQWEFA